MATVAVTDRQDAAAAGRLVGELTTGEGGLSGPDQWAALSTEDLIALAPVVRACAEDRGGAVGAEIMMSLAWLLLARPGGAGEARGALHGAVSLAPRPGQVFEAIAARLEAAGGPEALAPWLASAAALPMPADTRARALERSATLYAGPLGQLATARYPLMALIAAGEWNRADASAISDSDWAEDIAKFSGTSVRPNNPPWPAPGSPGTGSAPRRGRGDPLLSTPSRGPWRRSSIFQSPAQASGSSRAPTPKLPYNSAPSSRAE